MVMVVLDAGNLILEARANVAPTADAVLCIAQRLDLHTRSVDLFRKRSSERTFDIGHPSQTVAH